MAQFDYANNRATAAILAGMAKSAGNVAPAQILVLTGAELEQFAVLVARATIEGLKQEPELVGAQRPADRRMVKGLEGIQGLFNCSKSTAQKYKNTWLAPAVTQRGKSLYIDADMAMELFAERHDAIDGACIANGNKDRIRLAK